MSETRDLAMKPAAAKRAPHAEQAGHGQEHEAGDAGGGAREAKRTKVGEQAHSTELPASASAALAATHLYVSNMFSCTLSSKSIRTLYIL